MSDLRSSTEPIEDVIERLEASLSTVKALRANGSTTLPVGSLPNSIPSIRSHSYLHPLLLLSDSALPLGSFAFSSGLESYLAHQKLRQPASNSQLVQDQFYRFLRLTIQSLTGISLPYILAAYREPGQLAEWDAGFDAVTICSVARRTSVSQGKGLLGIWDKSFSGAFASSLGQEEAVAALNGFHEHLRSHKQIAAVEGWSVPPSGHYAPLWGVLTLIMGLSPHESVYMFLFSHLRTVISAAVRASVLGPYQAQAVLSSGGVQHLINDAIERWWDRSVEDAGQEVPVMDLWMGRHEILYSRIFNS